MRAAFGELDPIETRPEYRNRDARLRLMDEQGLEACILLPTLGVGMEAALEHDPEAFKAAFTAFNRWLDEDWGFNHLERIYAAPYVSLLDVDWAVRELDHALQRNARVILMRPAPVLTQAGRRSPGHPAHDAFWSKLNDSGIALAIHGGDSSYRPYERLWGLTGETEAFRVGALKRLLSASPIRDTMASLMSDKVFERFPNLRVATIETGSDWVEPLLKKLKTVAIQMPGEFGVDPFALFMEHVWVSPFFEDDVIRLVDLMGPGRVVFGSDYPHAEGLADPASFVKELDGVADGDVQRIMHDNARSLVTPVG
jgi:predicted TIM-barrel fold metal-dependent hydrolase